MPQPIDTVCQIKFQLLHLIGERLRVMYDDIKEEPNPDHLVDLLKQLDQPRSDEG